MKLNLISKLLLPVIIIGMLFVSGCSGSNPLFPDEPTELIKELVMSKVWTIKVDEQDFEFNFAELIEQTRSGEIEIVFGSNMKADELRQFFSVWFVDTVLPDNQYTQNIRCYAYAEAAVYDNGEFINNTGIRGAFDLVSDAQVFGLVWMLEISGFMDVPDAPPPDDIC